MNLNHFKYFVIIIWIRTIYSQICVNFRILGINKYERAKGETLVQNSNTTTSYKDG